jgi:hypothetical protein
MLLVINYDKRIKDSLGKGNLIIIFRLILSPSGVEKVRFISDT